MKIAINTLAMKSFRHGVGRYVGSLVKALLKIDTKNHYLLYVSKLNAKYFEVKGNPRVSLKFVPANRALRLLWEQTLLPLDLKRERVNVFYGPAFTVPLFKTCEQVVAVLDLTWFKQRKKHIWIKQLYFRTLIPLAVRQAEKVLVISQSTKKDLLQILKVPKEKIVVTYLGTSSSFRVVENQKKLSETRVKYKLPRQFILFIGVLEPRKNITGLIKAFSRLKKDNNLSHKLVIGGGRSYGWKNEEVFQAIKNLKVEDEVIFTDFISEADLTAVYNLADLFVLPSFYEGFGLPVLEAQACGCPVITSNLSSMPEVGGDAALLVDPKNVEELAKAMRRILTDGKLKAEMIRKGFLNVKHFSWEKTARETLKVFEEVYQEK